MKNFIYHDDRIINIKNVCVIDLDEEQSPINYFFQIVLHFPLEKKVVLDFLDQSERDEYFYNLVKEIC